MIRLNTFVDIAKKEGISTAFIKTVGYMRSKYLIYKYGPGVNIIEEDWDNLVILDAYRYDYFKKYSRFKGNLKRKFSQGNNSPEFIRNNFADRQLHDAVYITANPHARKLDDDIFYTIEFLLDRWDSEVGAVLPEDVTEAAIAAQKKYPNKRMIIHYMQPHDPHLGKTAETYQKRAKSPTDVDESSDDVVKWPKTRFPELYRKGEISKKELEEAYVETIEIVEESVENLLSEITGKTVVTSDHGENLGEEKYGLTYLEHSNDTKECRFVPWLELPYKQRKTITEEAPIGFESPDEKKVEEQLSQLGYL